jgi:hypothetical protein
MYETVLRGINVVCRHIILTSRKIIYFVHYFKNRIVPKKKFCCPRRLSPSRKRIGPSWRRISGSLQNASFWTNKNRHIFCIFYFKEQRKFIQIHRKCISPWLSKLEPQEVLWLPFSYLLWRRAHANSFWSMSTYSVLLYRKILVNCKGYRIAVHVH